MTSLAAAPNAAPASGRLSLVFPVAGETPGADFRGFETVDGESLIRRSLRSFAAHTDRIDTVYYIVRDEDAVRFDIQRRLAKEIGDVAFELVCLSSATAGPAETVARGVARRGISGAVILCDIDHRLDPTPLFDAIADRPECMVCLWPLAGEELKRWSVACVTPAGTIVEVAERRVPDAAGAFFGIIGCYYFADVKAVMDVCLERRFARFSEYFNALAASGTPVSGINLKTAEFFGDKDRIRSLEGKTPEFQGTIFCDIDGTVILHEDKPDYSRLPRLLPGSREKLRHWIAAGYCVVLCTARAKEDEARIVSMLSELDVPYHQIVTGLASGTRILINDRKPHAMFSSQAASIEIARNQGIASLEILSGRDIRVIRRFEGGSFAETLLVEENDKRFVRKRVAKNCNLSAGYHRLRDQFRTLERFAQLSPDLVPALFAEENNSHEYFYDMEFLGGHRPLADCDPGVHAAALDRLFDLFGRHIYSHRSDNRGAAEDWFRRHLESKIHPKIKSLAMHDSFRPLLVGDGIEIDGVFAPSLERLIAQATAADVLPKFAPQFLSLVHGDLTFQNIMTGPDGDTKVIDMEAQDAFEATELDLGKLFQSTHSQYERWWRSRTPLCTRVSPTSIKLNFQPAQPDAELLDALRQRWAHILGCPYDVVDLKGSFYLGLHLIRMVPFRMQSSMDHALYALATGLQQLNASLSRVSSRSAHHGAGAVRAAA